MESSCLIISILTDDLLLRILDCLHDDPDRKSFRLTCKCFHKIESVHRTRIKFFRPEFIPDLLRNYTRADTLDFSVCPRIYDGTIAVLLNNVSCFGWAGRVRKLVLSRTTSLRYSGLEMLIRSCPKLQSVDVSHCCHFGDREAAAISFAGDLKEVKLDKCLRVTDVGLAKIAIRCQNLEKISLKWCLEITDLGIDLLSNKCPNLKHLSVSYLKLSNESLRSISNMKKLQVLSMVGCGLVSDEGLHFIGNGCPSLQTIDVSRCEHISSTGLISIIRGCKGLQKLIAGYYFLELSTSVSHNLKDLKRLKTIRVNGAQVNDYFFQMISTNCLFLVEVGLSKCEGVNDSGIIQLAYNLPNLQILDLTCCNDVTDMAILAIARSCTNLLCLKLESCCLLTEISFGYLGSSCLLLEELDLTECRVNDKGLEKLSKCLELRCLRLGICADISDKGLSYIGSNCKNLKELDLYRCSNIGDDGLDFIANGCKKVRKLNLCYCNKITDKGMAYLSQLEELSDLEMRSLSEVTSTGMTALASGCRKLSELDVKNCGNIIDAGFWSLAYYSWNLQQINLSYCAVSDVGLCMMMGNLTRLQDAKLVNLTNVSVRGYELALRACCARLKKVKLVASLRPLLSIEILESLGASGCRIRWD
ncbi:F-box/LRR-repeat protein 3-like [Rutidosis leptorrhynchoides]|uniref:F-box/LRR-repeat protein 3-like n=1 Tax=Rutidosis leptorrhynchoides TaxID=125765 RepID=UPI003A98F7DE